MKAQYSKEYILSYKELAERLGIKEKIIAISITSYSMPSRIKIYVEV